MYHVRLPKNHNKKLQAIHNTAAHLVINSYKYSYKLLLLVPKSKQITYGDHAFSIAAPRLWNTLLKYIKLSINIEVFKCHLKTHLFKEFYI